MLGPLVLGQFEFGQWGGVTLGDLRCDAAGLLVLAELDDGQQST
jgi:hypothetical protein